MPSNEDVGELHQQDQYWDLHHLQDLPREPDEAVLRWGMVPMLTCRQEEEDEESGRENRLLERKPRCKASHGIQRGVVLPKRAIFAQSDYHRLPVPLSQSARVCCSHAAMATGSFNRGIL